MPVVRMTVPGPDLDAILGASEADLARLRVAALQVESALDRWTGILLDSPKFKWPVLGWPIAVAASLFLVFV